MTGADLLPDSCPRKAIKPQHCLQISERPRIFSNLVLRDVPFLLLHYIKYVQVVLSYPGFLCLGRRRRSSCVNSQCIVLNEVYSAFYTRVMLINDLQTFQILSISKYEIKGKYLQDLKEEAIQSEDERLWLRFHPKNEIYVSARHLNVSVVQFSARKRIKFRW